MLQSLRIIVRAEVESCCERSKMSVSLRIITCSCSSDRLTPVVTFHHNHMSFVVRDTLLKIAPFPGNFYCCFAGFNPGVHREHLVIAEKFGQVLSGDSNLVAREASTDLCDLLGLSHESFDELRVGVTQVVRGVSIEEVEISSTLYVPDVYTLTSLNTWGIWSIVRG